MDIRAGVIAAVILALLGATFVLRAGVRTLQAARKLTFYRLRRERNASAWRMLGFAVVLILLTFWLSFYGESVAYRYFPPSPTPSLTLTPSVVPSITLSPTITLTPTITDTPLYTDTPTITPTPFIPPAIEALFESVVTPNPSAVFSPIQFTLDCRDPNNYEAATVFQNPINYICGVYSYDNMLPGVQWSALWYRDGQLVHYQTLPWGNFTGGYDYADWRAPADEFLPGTYEVQIFVGVEWKVVGQFVLQGDAPTATPTISPTATITPSPTRTPSPMPTWTGTPLPSPTSKPTRTPPPSPISTLTQP